MPAVAKGRIVEDRVAQQKAEAVKQVWASRLTELLRQAAGLDQEALAQKLNIS